MEQVSHVSLDVSQGARRHVEQVSHVSQESEPPGEPREPVGEGSCARGLTCARCDIRQLIHVRKAGRNQVSQPSDVSLARVRHEQKST